MNAGTFNNYPQENTVPNWLLPCTCGTQRCHCNARFRPDILCIKGLPYQNEPPTNIDQNLTIQFIEFTYCNDKFSPETLKAKANKYKPLIEIIIARGWKIDPLIVITTCATAATHTPSMKILKDKFKLPMSAIRNTFKNINTIAIQYAMSILLQKRRLENNQPLTQLQDPPRK
jgi:hypothetical protein